MLVRDVLRAKGSGVVSVGPEITVELAVAKMVRNNIGSLPVLDEEGDLVGIISERDVLRKLDAEGGGLDRVLVSEVMTRDTVTCGPEEDLDCLLQKMTERRIAKVPILSGGRLVGIISVGDMIKQLYSQTLSEKNHLMSYIHGSY